MMLSWHKESSLTQYDSTSSASWSRHCKTVYCREICNLVLQKMELPANATASELAKSISDAIQILSNAWKKVALQHTLKNGVLLSAVGPHSQWKGRRNWCQLVELQGICIWSTARKKEKARRQFLKSRFYYLLPDGTYDRNKFCFKHVMERVIRIPHICHTFSRKFSSLLWRLKFKSPVGCTVVWHKESF